MIAIIIHILPQEIDQLEQTLIQLKRSSKYILNKDFLVEVVLNNNLTNWDGSKLDKSYFSNKLFNLENLTKSWAKTDFWESNNNEVLGCTDPRRACSKKYDAEAYIWLDVDIVFGETILFYLVNGFNILKNEELNLIITPETTRIWDMSWDSIVNRYSFTEEANHNNYFNRDPYLVEILGEEDKSLRKIDTFKFAGGWFTLLSKNLLEKVHIPEEMGPYYLDDTFIMECCLKGKNKGFIASQYVISNEVIIENNKFRYNHYKNYLVNIDRKNEFVNVAQTNFIPLVQNFINSL